MESRKNYTVNTIYLSPRFCSCQNFIVLALSHILHLSIYQSFLKICLFDAFPTKLPTQIHFPPSYFSLHIINQSSIFMVFFKEKYTYSKIHSSSKYHQIGFDRCIHPSNPNSFQYGTSLLPQIPPSSYFLSYHF